MKPRLAGNTKLVAKVANMKKAINLKLSHKGLILVAVPLIFEIVFVAVLVAALLRADHEIKRERHAKAVLTEANALLKNVMDCGTALFVFSTTGAEEMMERYQELREEIPREVHNLKIMLRDSPKQKESLARINRVGNRATELLAQGNQIISDSGALKRMSENKETLASMLTELNSELRKFTRELEESEQIDPQAEIRSRQLVTFLLASGVLVNIVLALSLAVYFNRGTTKRLIVLMDNTERLSRNHALHDRIGGGDEIGHLDHVFHNMAEALAEAARRKQELVSMVSHDLRTPLTSVQASLTLLSEGVLGALPARAVKEVTNAENNTSRLINLINDLLDIEKMEAGQLRIDCRPTEIFPLFEAAFEAVKAFAAKQNVNIKLNDNDLEIYADGDRIIQILVNLLSNAIKFSPAESTVTLNAVSVESDKFVELQVIDQGRGIPASFLPSMFQRFQQVDQIGDAKVKKGTGLGLAICKSLVELHGGEIGVRSEEGKGSTFWFQIPCRKPSEETRTESLPVGVEQV